MCLPELQFERMSASCAILADFLYVFGGRNSTGYVKEIERMSLKNIATMFEVIDCQLEVAAADIGVLPIIGDE